MDRSVSRWAEALGGSDETQRRTAARALAIGGQDLRPAMLALTLAAGDRDDEVRNWAAEALETAGPPAAADAERFSQLLLDSLRSGEAVDGESAYWAAKLLRRLGPEAASATGALTRVLDESPFLAVREQAAAALGRIGPAAADATAALRRAAGEGVPRLARLALSALDAIRGMAA